MDPHAPKPELPALFAEWPQGPKLEDVITREWLVTNGLGGYAAGTVAGCSTRRYHGLFIPSLPKYGRTVMLARVEETVHAGGELLRLDTEERMDGSIESSGLAHLRSFRIYGLIPEWTYEAGGARLQKSLVLVHGTNTMFLAYRHLGGPDVTLRVRPFPMFRQHERAVGTGTPMPVVRIHREKIELMADDAALPTLRMRLYSCTAAPFISLPAQSKELLFHVEKHRGYDNGEVQESPGYFECTLRAGETLAIGATSDGWEVLDRDPNEAFALELKRERRLLERGTLPEVSGTAARLVLAADQFVIDPVTRPKDEAWAHAIGQDARSVIAGYHWFTDWGRDTMISLEGLTLCTGRFLEAGAILRTFQHYVRDGLLPNLFPEGEHQGLYHTADATLWFFHAIDRYLSVSADDDLLRDIFPTLEDIVANHLKGTRFGIGVDPKDGLLRQGEEGFQLTWMDAKVDGWVVTPRRGKAVEINALWFNALRLMAGWAQQLGKDPGPYAGHAERAQLSFNKRFWNPAEQCLFDVVDCENGKDDPAVRPNQLFAVSLKHPVLRRDRWDTVLAKVRNELLTPVGLRTLARSHPDYKAAYDGDLRSRDAAYHQGTVWAWLLGHYIDATLKVNPDKAQARALLAGLEAHLTQACIGQISEIFDATEPYRARGCVAQAWSVAEALRAWLATDS